MEKCLEEKNQNESGLKGAGSYRMPFGLNELKILFSIHTRFMVVVLLASVSAAAIYLVMATPIYEASSLIQINENSANGGMEALITKQGDETDVGTQLVLLRSVPVINKMIDNLSEASKEYKLLFTGSRPEEIATNISITRVRGTSLYRLTVKDGIPERASLTANHLTSAYIEEKFERDAREKSVSQKWMRQKIREISRSIQKAETELLDYGKQNKLGLSIIQDDANDPKIAFYSTEIGNLNIQIMQEKNLISRVKSLLKQNDFTTIVMSNLDQGALSQVYREHEAAKVSYEELKKTYKTRHPKMLELALKTKRLSNDLRQRAKKVVTIYESSLEKIEKNREGYKKELDSLRLSLTNPKYIELKRKYTIDKVMYRKLIEKNREVEFAKSIEKQTLALIDQASTPKSPSHPNSIKVILSGILLGLIGSAALVVFIELTKPKIISEHQIESILGLRVLKSIRKIRFGKEMNLGKEDMFLFNDPSNIHAEDFRFLRNSVESVVNKYQKVIMVTSPEDDDGKAFISLNLSTAISMVGKRCLLVELDTESGKLSKLFQSDMSLGIYGYFAGGFGVEECIVQTQYEGLDLLLSGRQGISLSEVISSEQFTELLEELKNRYDVVVIDSPKILKRADSLAIGRLTDFIIFVTAFGKPIENLGASLKVLGELRSKILGLVLNKSLVLTDKLDLTYKKLRYLRKNKRSEIVDEGTEGPQGLAS